MSALTRERMWLTVLGPVRARLGEREIDLGSPQQRALLAVLLVRAGQPASLAEIVDAMWGTEPPLSAVNAVHRGVGGLRRALQPGLPSRAAGRWLIRSAGGYRLAVDAEAADLVRYRWLVGRARAADAGSAAAAGLFADALDLWQGPVASGVGPQVRAHPLFVAVEREHLAVVRAAADAALAAGVADRLLPAVARAADQAPLDEPLQARLVLLLAAASGPAAALEHYQRVRVGLAQDLGLDPGVALQAARDQVLRRAARPGPGAEAGPPPPAQLPADLPIFVGRRAEPAQALASHPPRAAAPDALVITAIGGTAGVGETSLAIHWAHQVAGRYPDGQLYVNLRGFDPAGPPVAPGEALHDMLTALGVGRQEIPAGADARAALFRTRVAGRRVLIVLDNARDLAQVRPLLPGSAGCLVIVAGSRRRRTGSRPAGRIGAAAGRLSSEGADQPAVDGEVGAGDVGRAVAGQQQHEVRDLLRAGEPARHRGAGGLPRDVLGRGTAGAGDGRGDPVGAEPQPGRDRPRADGVHPDAPRTHLLGQRLAEAGQRGLGGAVVDDERVGQDGVDGADRHDAGPAALQQVRERRAGRADRGEEVDGQRRGPVLVGHRQEAARAGLHRPDVVDQDVEAAGQGDGGVDQPGRAVRRRQVRRHDVDRRARGELGQLGAGRAGGGHHRDPLLGEPPGDGQADALARPGDQGGRT
ncbi:hypothetical protein GCM10007977_001830 [Dactylosporangium sucinum]|uniref:OmpR/PhoB-type domain-containing protein n=1 Tax=Dactylosporangium sucinum TaxID=1424081 RepID=A0A917WG54_9ACTN|nr:hypothetical protein GCM10007977_001830 [Dactylosporangium sucinum]